MICSASRTYGKRIQVYFASCSPRLRALYASAWGDISGSPVISRQGEVVGIVFDSNLQGLGNEFAYSDEQGRTVSVSAQAVVEALRKVYDANELAAELGR